jgi:hypothetical protein
VTDSNAYLSDEAKAHLERIKRERRARRGESAPVVPLHSGEQLEEPREEEHKEDTWPAMDKAAFIGLAGDFVRELEPHTEADPVGLLLQFLVTFGNVIGNAPYYLVEADRHHANLFAVMVGNSAKGRKGTAGGRVRAITKFADETWATERAASGMSSGEGLINSVRDEVSKWNAREGRNEVIDPGVRDKRLLVTEPEFAGALSVMDRHGNTLSPVIRNAWDGQRLQTLTRNSPLVATGAHISIIAHITADETRARLSRTDMANGFANRFLFACVRRSKLLAHGGSANDAAIEKLGARLTEAVKFARQVGRVKMTGAAADAWTAVYPALSSERLGLLGSITARAEAQTIRLALVYALLDSAIPGTDGTNPPVSIDLPHLKAALAVWNYCDESAARIFGDASGDPVADEILATLRRSPDGMTRTDLNNLFGRHRTSDQISAALGALYRAGRAKFETAATAGRPVERWFAIKGSAQ